MEKNKLVNENDGSRGGICFTNSEIETIRRNLTIGATDDEFIMFMHIVKTYGLDPFNKDIWFIKDQDNLTIMTSRDGYLKIADRHPEYDGLVSDVVRENDLFKRSNNGIEHQYGKDRGRIVGAYAMVYRKDRTYPVYVFAPFEEYNACTKTWNQYPSAMILKVAESMALKRAFTVSGLVSREEMDIVQKSSYQKPGTQNEYHPDMNDGLSSREVEIKNIINKDHDLKIELYSYLNHIKQERSLSNSKICLDDLTNGQYQELKDILISSKQFDTNKHKSA